MQTEFGSGSCWSTPLINVDGSIPANPTVVKCGVLQEWNTDFTWDMKLLYGTYDMPVRAARGKAKVEGKMKVAQMNAQLWNNMVFGIPGSPTGVSSGETLMSEDTPLTPVAALTTADTAAITENSTALTLSGSVTDLKPGMLISIAGAGPSAAALVTVLASGSGTAWVTTTPAASTVTTAAVTFYPTISITPPNSGTYVAPWGVRYSAANGGGAIGGGGVLLSVTEQAPTAGEYVAEGNLGVFNFAAADVANVMLVSYEYTITGGYTIAVNRQLLGNLPVFMFMGKMTYEGIQLTIKLYQVISTKLTFASKLDDFMIPEMDFTAYANNSGQVAQLSNAEL